jgi:hypothetical protein
MKALKSTSRFWLNDLGIDFIAEDCASPSAVVNSPPQLLMEWLDEGGRGPMKVARYEVPGKPKNSGPSRRDALIVAGHAVPGKPKKQRPVPEGRSDSSQVRSAWKTKK